ncbi:hypothetical protein C6P45_000415 [Maudiozyma exigua]|uniref:Rpr2-domain-containing protein n=1 Tax=Maudiozyma exigua TaxID=34358 RepID=A0A9P7B973_MAUEX|nr:hypothetical protein C6P45_000415 [Kazachstania exigua]
MNRIQREKFRDRNMRQKYDLLHIKSTLNTPALSGLYLKNFYNAAKRYDLTLPSEIVDSDLKFCGNCGVVHVPLYNTDISSTIEGTKEMFKMVCKKCQYEAIFENPRIESAKVVRSKSNSPTLTATLTPKSTVTPSLTSNKINKNKAKDRAKKRKNNSLNNLLANKKKEQNNGSSSSLSSLTLESFMKK